MKIKKVRYIIFLKDIFILAISAFGGPQAHMAMMLDRLVKKRGYIDEQGLLELHALCQFLPGPTSTQTLTAIGFKVGGPNLAYLTLLVWILPAFIIMSTAGVLVSVLKSHNISLEFTRFIQPMAVGIVAYSALIIVQKLVTSKTSIIIMILSTLACFFFRTPYVFPITLLVAGSFTAIHYKRHQREEKKKIKIEWSNFILWGGVLIGAALLGTVTSWRGIRLFENFYRIGSLIFGGGQVLIPHMYTEFVEFKGYLTSDEFLSGLGLVQAVPGPVFSITAFIGSIAMKDDGITGQYMGSFMASMGVFLPGTFLIFFVIRFWDELKKFRIVKASLNGVNAGSAGMVLAATVFLAWPSGDHYIDYVIMLATFGILKWGRIPAPFIILGGLALGFVL